MPKADGLDLQIKHAFIETDWHSTTQKTLRAWST